jgi:hypothetical protein
MKFDSLPRVCKCFIFWAFLCWLIFFILLHLDCKNCLALFFQFSCYHVSSSRPGLQDCHASSGIDSRHFIFFSFLFLNIRSSWNLDLYFSPLDKRSFSSSHRYHSFFKKKIGPFSVITFPSDFLEQIFHRQYH